VAQLSTLGIKIGLRFYGAGWFGEDLSSLIQMSKLSAVSRIQLAPVYAASKCGAAGWVSVGICLVLL
jgi:hypothetical protein